MITPHPVACPIKGHDHAIKPIYLLTQRGTGDQAFIWECPTGRYRWFCLASHGTPTTEIGARLTRPRYGWKQQPRGAQPIIPTTPCEYCGGVDGAHQVNCWIIR